MMFPFTLPTATAFYLVLYLGTLVLHVAFMAYVLAGSAYLATIAVWQREDRDDPFAGMLRSWLPFMLGVAITAGVAPLLFVQILYRTQFYTANLLLFHRWMAVLPMLLVGFYLLYLSKTRWAEQRPRWVAAAIAVPTAACFGFVAWSWTENHLLSLQGQDVWTEQYLSDSLVFSSAEVAPRLAMWCCGTLPLLSLWLSWQLWWPLRGGAQREVPGTGRAAVIGLSGLLGAVACGGLYWLAMPAAHRDVLTSAAVVPYGVIVACSVAGQIVVWWQQSRKRELCPKRLTLLSCLVLLMLLGVAALRESLRVASLDMPALAERHQRATAVGGFGVFVTFLVLNLLGIVWCLRTVIRAGGRGNLEATAQANPTR